MYNSFIITLFCYNTDYTMDPKNSVIMRFQYMGSNEKEWRVRNGVEMTGKGELSCYVIQPIRRVRNFFFENVFSLYKL